MNKFEEALSITLRRKQEAGNKKKVKTILSRKYRSIRSDLQSQKKCKHQYYKRERRLSDGKKDRAKDMIHKGHKQFALTWGMMMGVQISIDRQAEFSEKMRGNREMCENLLQVTDFMAVDKYTIPLEIKDMSSHFKFKDYAPSVFGNLRNFWGVDK